jgi:hypothetical protein
MALPPSATTFSTPAEAFKYPLPTVRQFHKQLQAALDEKNARLRTLVGGSYRQLLGTAEMIVDMRRDIELAESKLAKVAEGCGRSAVGKRAAGLGKLGITIEVGAGRDVDLGWLARMKVLDGCVLVVGRLLRGKESSSLEGGWGKGERLVIAAKVLVLSRLLVKSLGDEVKNEVNRIDGVEDLVEEMKRKLGGLRRRLLGVLERILEKIDGDRDDLPQVLCAYSLATSSGAKDVLRHFLHVRGEAMALAFEEDEEAPKKEKKEESIMRALGLFTRTLLDAQALVPRQLSDALLALKGKPLLKDETIRSLEGLRLDISERWFGDEILFFTPYIRHDELDGSQAGDMLKGWAKKASEVLLGGFDKTLGRIMEFKTVVELRTKIFEAWISEGGKAKGFDSSVMLDGLRKVVNDRLLHLLETRITKLHLVGTEIEAVLDSWASGVKMQTSLWNDELIEMELTGGAGDFKKAVISGVHGRNNSISRVIKGYETWRYLIDELVTSIDQLRSQRWDDDIDNLEDDETLENRNTLLSKDDPHMLQNHMDTHLEHAYKALHQKIAALLTTHTDSEYAGPIAIFILRVLRDIRAALPKRPDLKSFGLSIIPELHSILATSASSAAISSLTASITTRKRVVGRALWEGTPELPVHPSPAAFRFLHSLTSSMATASSDLWSPAAVGVLKRHLRDALGQEWSLALEPMDKEGEVQANGHKSDDGEEEANATDAEVAQDAQLDGNPKADDVDQKKTRRQEILIQSLFDAYLLERALPLPNSVADGTSSEDGLLKLEESLKSRIELSGSEAQRLQRGALEYWKRTGLLFGLLG